MANPKGIGGAKKGEVRNPNGRPSGSIDFMIRMKQLVEMYSADEIVKIVSDPKQFGQMRAFDAMILRRLAEGLAAEGRQSMESLLNRVMGMPTQYVESKNTDHVTLSLAERKAAAVKEAAELLAKAAERTKK